MPFRRDFLDLPPSQAFHLPVNEMKHGDAHRPPQGDGDVTDRVRHGISESGDVAATRLAHCRQAWGARLSPARPPNIIIGFIFKIRRAKSAPQATGTIVTIAPAAKTLAKYRPPFFSSASTACGPAVNRIIAMKTSKPRSANKR